jgi:hypothetical protein
MIAEPEGPGVAFLMISQRISHRTTIEKAALIRGVL